MSKLLKNQVVGLPETKIQQGRTFDERCWVHTCIRKQKIRKSNNEKGGNQEKKSKTHKRQWETRPLSVCECM